MAIAMGKFLNPPVLPNSTTHNSSILMSSSISHTPKISFHYHRTISIENIYMGRIIGVLERELNWSCAKTI